MGRATVQTATWLVVGMSILAGRPGLAVAEPGGADVPDKRLAGTVAAGPTSPRPAESIEITIEPISWGPGGTATTAVMVRVLDSDGVLTDAKLELDLEAGLANLEKPARLAPGVFRAPLVVTSGTREEFIEIGARAGQARAKARFAVAPVAAKVTVTPHPPVRADGSTAGQLEILDVSVTDAFGNPVNEAPKGSGGGGEFRAALRIGPGHWALPYAPPRITEDVTEALVVTAGAASTTVELQFVARRISMVGGVKVGVAVGGGGVGPALGVEGAAWTRYKGRQLGLVAEVGWRMRSSSGAATVGTSTEPYRTMQNYPSILISAAWRTQLTDRWTLRATLGGGGGLVWTSAKLGGQPEESETGFAPVLSGSLSVSPRDLRAPLFLEARATWVGDAGLSTMSGSNTTFLVLLGYRFDVD